MIQLYMTPKYTASIKAKDWLENHGLDYKEVNILTQPSELRGQLIHIISLLEGDVFDIISTRSKQYRSLKNLIEDLSFTQLIDYLISEPRLIRQPLIFDGVKLQIGFNSTEIRSFIPHHIRQVELNFVKSRIEERREK
ncbi:Spx/MgsR family RNA polymerase-binding regulatory protein (plasmid) [Lactococcus lactis subsp. lactis]|uniref:Spx/MgsR family RNA polymerase-binding regulatory protein n=1 Tax=Lactococcus lactis TaxID=1358 RepID=UPI0026497922|nr:Spx/MgsR family RNA polymerase-binding regulatory protein [Lactococcus lactis]WKB49907.1 Spx/MgsR family RNA polymerase-binding regulatory protein [Lactococcus lactis subsp. lactis]